MKGLVIKLSTLAAIVGLLVAATMPVFAQQDPVTKEDLEATISALETQVAEIEAQEEAGTPASTPTAAASWNLQGTSGNGLEVLVPAEDDSVDIIAVGEYDGRRLPVVIHNNTADSIERVDVEGMVLDGDGQLFAVGASQSINPGWIEANAVGVGYLYFDGIDFPVGATVDMTVSYKVADSRDSISTLEPYVAEWSGVEDRIVGFLTNPHSQEIIGPIEVDVVCLAGDGSITSFNDDFTDSDRIPIGERIPFQVTLDQPSCEYILIVADAFNW